MPIYITAEDALLVGNETVIQGPAPSGTYAAVFEDDGQTGYFYAMDVSREDNPVENALHIYNTQDVTDREKPSTVKIGWSEDSKKVVLLINDYPHAVFDFSKKRGYCRTGFPPPAPQSGWDAHSHDWDDEALNLFA